MADHEHDGFDLAQRARDWELRGRPAPDAWTIPLGDYRMPQGVVAVRGINGSRYENGHWIDGVPVLQFLAQDGTVLGEVDGGRPCPPFCE